MGSPEIEALNNLFNNAHMIIKYAGISVGKSHSLILTYFFRTYSSIILLLMCVYTVITIFFANALELVGGTWFVLAMITFGFLLRWQVKNIFETDTKLLEEATSLSGCLKYIKQLTIVSNILFVINMTFVLLFTGRAIWYIVFADANSQHPAVIHYMFMTPYGKFLYCFTFFYMNLGYGINSYIFSMACILTTVEFVCLNKQLKQETELTLDKLKLYFTKHTKLVSTVDQLDDTFNIYILAQISAAIPIVIISAYKMIVYNASFDSLSFLWLFSQCIAIVVFTVGPAAVNWAASDTSLIVYQKTQFFEMETTSEMYHMISWFALKCANKPAGVTVGGFFVITNSFLLTAASLIISYVTLLKDSYSTVTNSNIPLNTTFG